MNHEAPKTLRGRRVTVMGLGRFGGGLGVTRWLVEQGASVLVTDLELAEKLVDAVAQLTPLVERGCVELRLGSHQVEDFVTPDLVVANVAVSRPWDNQFLKASEAAGVEVTTEIGLMLRLLPSARQRIVGITGSAGKSTTTAMIHHALTHVVAGGPYQRRVVMGGNIGGSLLGELARMDAQTMVVLELSSAMLYWIDREYAGDAGGGWSPGVAVVTNIAPNHVDWHGSVEHYVSSKQHLLRHQRAGDVAVLGSSVRSWVSEVGDKGARVVEPELEGFRAFTSRGVERLLLPGEHNRVNAAAALAACRAMAPEADVQAMAQAIASFGGLAHRLQIVAELSVGDVACAHVSSGRGVLCYNDSKSTTPESTLRAVEAVASVPGCDRERIHLIVGGYDKKVDLSAVSGLSGQLAGMYTIGATGGSLARDAAGAAAGGFVRSCGSLLLAMEVIKPRLRAGDVVLLSPGCASWDQYVNFEARGDEFVEIVGRWQRMGG